MNTPALESLILLPFQRAIVTDAAGRGVQFCSILNASIPYPLTLFLDSEYYNCAYVCLT